MVIQINKNARSLFAKPLMVEIDPEDVDIILPYTWVLSGKNEDIICATINGKKKTLGRWILGYSGSLEVDHRDRDIFNNQKSNLRLATKSQQMANRGPIGEKRYKGVSYHKRDHKYQATIEIDGNCLFLGYFALETDAAFAYDRAASKQYGEFAYLNFPEFRGA